jgi:ABC-type antimicrobial peptide transport system permease subunit
VDPALRLDAVLPMNEIQASELRVHGYLFQLQFVASALALMLSLAGLYAVTSFTVARRTREIGVRVALGADARRVAGTIVRRPLAQAALGVLLGLGLLAASERARSEMSIGLSPGDALVVVAYGAALLVVCLLACVAPTRRALAVQPTEALRSDG